MKGGGAVVSGVPGAKGARWSGGERDPLWVISFTDDAISVEVK